MSKKQISIVLQREKTKSALDVPQCSAMVPAKDLLQTHEQYAIEKIGGFFTVIVNGQLFTVRHHDPVPQFASVLRTEDRSLVGFPWIVSR